MIQLHPTVAVTEVHVQIHSKCIYGAEVAQLRSTSHHTLNESGCVIRPNSISAHSAVPGEIVRRDAHISYRPGLIDF